MLGVGEFRVARGHGVMLTEVLDLLHGQVEASEVEPGVDEHTSVAGGEDEAVPVQPLGVGGVVLHLISVKDSTDLSGAEGKSHVAGGGGGDGVHAGS